ncbi:PAS domain S-box-containing protein [Deinococcus sp. HSC-46F16]|uniref:sensor histidine kinase n=1 Tax=Deinococcus sp. HSC-46F16 TaxID=2910968 RepID=UPI00209DCAE5|nr:ATP-binding protein [Deinococcus sp. HSC-46F16]MCP2014553.1 PAS domain S-box-containing protein [Deinococcus sp. HSC-46F16]
MTHDSSPTTELHLASPATLGARLQALEAQVLELQSALSQAQALFQHSPGAALLLTEQGQILDVNARGAALLGTSPSVLQGRSLNRFLESSSRTSFAVVLAQVFAGRGRQTSECQLLRPDGELLDVALEAVLHVREGQAPQCHLTLTDVTAFKLAHRALWATQQAQATQLQDQGLKLRALQEEFEQVVLKSGQELDHTLTRAQSFLTLAQQQPDQPGHLLHVREAVEQTRGLVSSMKQYMQVRFLRARMRPVDLGRVLREVLKDVGDQLTERGVQVTAMPLPTLYGDSQAFQIILHEYVHNALKFTRTCEHARVRVRVQEDSAEYRIGVEDNGVGFNMRQKDRAFELFGRLHASGLYEGTGLGLALVRRLCERFGGRAWGEGKVDQGATFWFAWPKLPAEK